MPGTQDKTILWEMLTSFTIGWEGAGGPKLVPVCVCVCACLCVHVCMWLDRFLLPEGTIF